jgi:cytochrome c-type biogenesis protein CcmE
MLGAGTFVALNAFKDQLMFFMTPTQLKESEKPIPATKKFRLGGIVKEGSVSNTEGTLDVSFVITDMSYDIPVFYRGMLPDLFREGQSVVVEGTFDGDLYKATEVLAKHDENYAVRTCL